MYLVRGGVVRWVYYLPVLTICTYLPYLRRYLKVLGTSGGELEGWIAQVACCWLFLLYRRRVHPSLVVADWQE